MNSKIATIKKILNDQKVVTELLKNGKTSRQPRGVNFAAIPSLYPIPFLRRAFNIHTATGESYFLKINENGNSIYREVAFNKWLQENKNIYFDLPKIITWDQCKGRSTPGFAYWFLEEWTPAKSLNSSVLLSQASSEKIICGLVWLNKQVITSRTAKMTFGVRLPQKEKLLEILNKQRIGHFEAAFESSKTIQPFLKPLQKIIGNFSFSKKIGIVHGDFHLKNILINRTRKENMYTWIDWEDATLDHPLSDIAHLLVFENFSPASIQSLKRYLAVMNFHTPKDSRLSEYEAWLLASIWLARTLRWRLRTEGKDSIYKIEEQAIQSTRLILNHLKGLSR